MITQTKHHQMVRKPLGAERDGLVDIISCDWCACRTCQSTGSGLRFVFCRKSLSVVTLSRLLPSCGERAWRVSLVWRLLMLRYKDPLNSSFTSPVSRSPNVHTKMLLGNLLNFLVFGLLQRNLEKDLVIDSKMNRCKRKGVWGARGRPNLDFYVWVIKFSSWAKLP